MLHESVGRLEHDHLDDERFANQSCRDAASCRIGTTVATNALLENKGERFALITSTGSLATTLIFESY